MTSTTITPEQVRPHDLIRAVTIPVRVPADYGDSNHPVLVLPTTAQIELLHRPNPKPPVGTVLTGKQVKSRAWKRGTRFCYVKRGTPTAELLRLGYQQDVPLYTIVFLTPDGQFAYKTTSADLQVKITDDSEFILAYRPTEESEVAAPTVYVELTGAEVNGQDWPEGTRLNCIIDATPHLGGNNVADVFTMLRGQWVFDGGEWHFSDDDRFILLDNLD